MLGAVPNYINTKPRAWEGVSLHPFHMVSELGLPTDWSMISSNCSAFAIVPALGYPVTEKLARNNHALWKAQVWSALKGAQVGHFLDKAAGPPP